MAQLRDYHQNIIDRDTVIFVIGPEDSQNFKRYFSENDMPFFGLPDPTHSVLKLYGQEVSLFKLGRMPAQVIVDKNGYVRYVHYGKNMSDIPEIEALIKIIDDLNQPNNQ